MATLYDWKGALLAKMKAEGCRDLSPEEINRVFKGCVAENRCIMFANELIKWNQITLADLKGGSYELEYTELSKTHIC